MIGVIGGREVSDDIYKIAESVGREIAKRGGTVICGGLTGVMEAACKGAKAESGTTIGVLPGEDVNAANDFVDIKIATGIGEARNLVIVNSAEAFIAVDGKEGTLSEIAFALERKKPVAGLFTHDVQGVKKFEKTEEAVDYIFGRINE